MTDELVVHRLISHLPYPTLHTSGTPQLFNLVSQSSVATGSPRFLNFHPYLTHLTWKRRLLTSNISSIKAYYCRRRSLGMPLCVISGKNQMRMPPKTPAPCSNAHAIPVQLHHIPKIDRMTDKSLVAIHRFHCFLFANMPLIVYTHVRRRVQ